MTGYIPIGNGIGAAILADGYPHLVGPPLFAQIERERRDGPLYMFAIRGGRRLFHPDDYPLRGIPYVDPRWSR